jgi:hypothetical protein
LKSLSLLFGVILFVSSTSSASSVEKEVKADGVLTEIKETTKETTKEILETLNETRERREKADYFVMANYSLLDLLIPSKYGVTLGAIKTADKTWEFEYLKGSVAVPFIIEDLGKVSDERFSLIGRSYFGGNSFNLSYGLTYFDFSLHLGDKIMNRVTGGAYPSMDLVQIQSLGFNVAFGNRWTFNKNVTFGIDWISWAQPVYTTNEKSAFLDHANNQQDKDDVEKAMKLISYFPRLALVKLQIGILF